MANVLNLQVTNDGWRNAAVKLTGVVDTPGVSLVPAVALSDFVTNDPNLVFRGLRLDKIEYSLGDGIQIQVEWNGLVPQQLTPIAGRGHLKAKSTGGWNPDMTKTGYDGSINLRVTGPTPASVQNFTIELEMVKLYVR